MLFDLEKDIGETEDLAKAMPGVVQQLAARKPCAKKQRPAWRACRGREEERGGGQ